MRLTAVILLCVVVLSGCGPLASCQVQSEDYVAAVEAIAVEWDDANALANSTPRSSLAPQIAELQAIARRAEALEHPECAEKAHKALGDYMNRVVDSYILFLAQDEAGSVEATEGASVLFGFWTTEFVNLKVGLPPYDK